MTYIAYSQSSIFLFTLGLIINGIMLSFSGWAGISHELFHRSIFKEKKLNTFLSRLFSLLTWNNYSYFRYSHYLHHKFALFENDPEAPSETKPALSRIFWELTIDFPFLIRRIKILLKNAQGNIPGIVGKQIEKNGELSQKNAIANGAKLVLVFHLMILFYSVFSRNFQLILLINLGPYTFTFLARSLETIQHHGKLRNVEDFRLNTRTVRINPLIGMLYANMNFHVEHHIFPALPFYNIKKANLLLHKIGFFTEKEQEGFLSIISYLYKNTNKKF